MGASGSTPLSGCGAGPTAEAYHQPSAWAAIHNGIPIVGDVAGHGQVEQVAVSSSPFAHIIPAMKEKKRRNLASLATLKKRLVRRRRASKCFDHSQVNRDFLSCWSTRDLMQLVDEYEATGLLKELHLQAEVARPCASTCQNDLCELYDFKYCSDTQLVYKGVHFSVHKAIVCVRCPFFRELLGKINTFGAKVPVNLDVPGLNVELFNDLLRYLYSGEFMTPSPLSVNAVSAPLTAANVNYVARVAAEGSGLQNFTSHCVNESPSSTPSPSYNILLRLAEQFGVPNDLDHDLKHLLDTGLYSDASLVFLPGFSSSFNPTGHGTEMLRKCHACTHQAEFSCHAAILAARSPFFRNVILRHQRRNAEKEKINTANQKIRIVLDESIIPRRFARVLLHSMYRDTNDLFQQLHTCVCKCATEPQVTPSVGHNITSSSTSNASASMPISSASSSTSNVSSSVSSSSTTSSSAAANSFMSSNGIPYKEVMELFEIARFLELDSLIQGCEDLIIDSLGMDTLVPILKWSEQPHGSPWVKRQTLCFLREEFAAVSSSNVLLQLEACHLIEAIKSDFLQASELEVLQSVIKWGETKLVKRMEETEPNVVSQTAHSLRRGLRKREINDSDLRDVIASIMPHVRIGHILPLDSDILASAAKRGLISTLPPYMVGEDTTNTLVRGISSWLRGRGSGLFVRPRYFSPYVDESKTVLEEKLGRPGEMILNRSNRYLTSGQIPDALYMVEKPNLMAGMSTGIDGDNFQGNYKVLSPENYQACCLTSSTSSSGSGCYEEIDALGAVNANQVNQLPIIEDRVLSLMKQRECELKMVASNHRALILVTNRCEVIKLIQLRVVREFGLPDAASQVLHAAPPNYASYPTTETASDEVNYGAANILTSVRLNGGIPVVIGSDKDPYSYATEVRLETGSPVLTSTASMTSGVRAPSESFLNQYEFEPVSQPHVPPPPLPVYLTGSHHTLSEVMPDIAMATAVLDDMHLFSKRSTESHLMRTRVSSTSSGSRSGSVTMNESMPDFTESRHHIV